MKVTINAHKTSPTAGTFFDVPVGGLFDHAGETYRKAINGFSIRLADMYTYVFSNDAPVIYSGDQRKAKTTLNRGFRKCTTVGDMGFNIPFTIDESGDTYIKRTIGTNGSVVINLSTITVVMMCRSSVVVAQYPDLELSVKVDGA